MRVRVDENICQGHTLCAMAAPEIFGLRDEDGHSYVLVTGELTADQQAAANSALIGCPERAISFTD